MMPWRVHLAVRNGLATSLATADAADALYLSEVAIDDTPVTLADLKSLRGLVCAHIIKRRPRVLCLYWRSREAFEREESVVQDLLRNIQQPGMLRIHGFVSGYWARKGLPWYTVVTVALAIIGALESTRLLLLRLFEQPQVLITAGRAGAINYFPEQQLFESFKVTSRAPAEQKVVIGDVSLCREGIETRGTYDPHIVNNLSEDQSETIQVSLAVPAQVGSYELLASTKTDAGWLRRSRTQSYVVPVKVWSPVPSAAFQRLSPVSETVGMVFYRLEVGYAAPAGLDCTAAFVGSPPDITAIIPRMGGNHDATQLESAGAGQFKVVSQRWITRPFAEFASTTVPILFQAAQRVQWHTLSKSNFLFNCSPHAVSTR